MGGTCMELDRAEEFAPKSQGIMKFTLDDRHKTKVVKKFTVKSVSGNRIHCEFFKDKEYERELGFYLRK